MSEPVSEPWDEEAVSFEGEENVLKFAVLVFCLFLALPDLAA